MRECWKECLVDSIISYYKKIIQKFGTMELPLLLINSSVDEDA